MDTYTIYLVNTGADALLFCCFLQPPPKRESDPEVFVTSEVSLNVTPHYGGVNRFVIPARYVVAAGAGTDPVALDAQIASSITSNADLMTTWNATYADAPPRQQPGLASDASKTGADQIVIKSNDFNKVQNESNRWFSSQSFGIMTKDGFIGMTWSPMPGQTKTLTLAPKPTFYVAIGNDGSGALADWSTISNAAQVVQVPGDFRYGECTVTCDGSGKLHVSKGKPAVIMAAADRMSTAAAFNKGEFAGDQAAILERVDWLSGPEPGSDYTSLSGDITVDRVLAAGLTFFVLSGVIFILDGSTEDQTAVGFSYSGAESADAIKGLFRAGATLVFR